MKTPDNLEHFVVLKTQIENARATALPESTLENIKNEQDEATNKFLRGDISGKEYDSIMDRLDVSNGVVKARNIPEFHELLRLLNWPKGLVEETLAHENAHMSEAISLGVSPVYHIQFLQTSRGISTYPGINFKFPASMPDEERRSILKKIIEAPSDPSSRDIAQAGK